MRADLPLDHDRAAKAMPHGTGSSPLLPSPRCVRLSFHRHHATRSYARHEQGFTLVELLFALVAGSLLLVTLSGAIRGIEIQYRRHQAISDAGKVDAIGAFLTSEIDRARPPATGAAFSGEIDRLALTVPPPRSLGSIGPVRLTLAVADGEGGKSLTARFASAIAGQVLPATAVQSVVLAEGFKDIRFAYLRRGSDPATSLPRLITIQFTGQDNMVLPLGVEPRITMGADCVFDPISLTCRH